MRSAKIEKISEPDYLAMERQSPSKHEYHQGAIFSMAGASRKHNLIVTNLVRELGGQLRPGCRIYANDMKLRIKETGSYVYPDIIITCGDEKFFDDAEDVLIEADLMVIIEVISDSTEAYDRGDKFANYRKLYFLREFILISQKERKIEQFSRQQDVSWKFLSIDAEGSAMALESMGLKIKLDHVYSGLFGDGS